MHWMVKEALRLYWENNLIYNVSLKITLKLKITENLSALKYKQTGLFMRKIYNN